MTKPAANTAKKAPIPTKATENGGAEAVKGVPRASEGAKPELQATPRKRADWEAVERDYRTGKNTLRELGTKHGCSHQAISDKADALGWTKDLAVAIKQATNAKLVAELVDNEVAKTGQQVANVVLAAAELNKQIIMGHRSRLAELAAAVDQSKARLLSLGDSVADIREAATFVQAVNSLANSTKTLIEQERKAYQIDDEAPDTSNKPTRVELVAL